MSRPDNRAAAVRAAVSVPVSSGPPGSGGDGRTAHSAAAVGGPAVVASINNARRRAAGKTAPAAGNLTRASSRSPVIGAETERDWETAAETERDQETAAETRRFCGERCRCGFQAQCMYVLGIVR